MHEQRISGRLQRRILGGIALFAGVLASIACGRTVSSLPQGTSRTIPDPASNSVRREEPPDSALQFPFVPVPARTPGAVLDVTAADVCISGYSRRVRNVPAAVKRQAYALYGLRTHESGEYEVDHLISLSLGGSNSIRNLWPQSFRTHPWNAYVKDELENELHRRVCAGTIDLAKAQYVISHNWVIGYRTYVQQTPPSATAYGKKRRRRARTQTQSQFQGPVP